MIIVLLHALRVILQVRQQVYFTAFTAVNRILTVLSMWFIFYKHWRVKNREYQTSHRYLCAEINDN